MTRTLKVHLEKDNKRSGIGSIDYREGGSVFCLHDIDLSDPGLALKRAAAISPEGISVTQCYNALEYFFTRSDLSIALFESIRKHELTLTRNRRICVGAHGQS